ncbi:hypothetical protein [Turicimonas muris]|uniref:hypothetical protein n=1 Tax=Turicimonas muris TaxID=1796652 RepID=UPI0026299479|nr:hypothetical protein [Turicimonas muris]
MPRVPTYNDNVPGVIESGGSFTAPVNNVAPSFDYEAVMNRAMQPIQNFAGAVTKLEAHYNDTVVKARADEQLDAFNNELQTTLYDPEKGYFSQQGKNAVLQWDQSQETIQSIYSKHLSEIDDPNVQQAFKSVALQRVNSLREKSILYRNQQNNLFIANASKAHADSLIEHFAVSGFGEDSNRTMASLMNEVEYQGKKGGQSEEWIKAQKANYASLAYAKAYSNMAISDPVGAMEHFQNVGSKVMNAETSNKVFGMLYHSGYPQLQVMLNNAGGATAIALSSGAVQRATGGKELSRMAQAQQGLGTPPKVDDKVLNTMGYKGCNPLNIRATTDKWQGAIGQNEKGYLIFSSPVDGIRAAAKVLKNYDSKYGINTIEEIVSRFAPASENPTGEYIQNVVKATGYKAQEKLDLKNPEVMQKLIQAMMNQEIGGVAYSEETISAGVRAGLGIETSALSDQQVQPTPKLTAQDLAFNPNAKTGIPVIDNLPLPYKLKLFQSTQGSSRQGAAQLKNQLNLAIKNGLALAQDQGDISKMPGLDSFVQVYGQEEGVRLYEESQKQARFNSYLHMAPTMSVEEMNAMSRQLTPAKDDPMYAQRIKDRDEFDKACIQITKQRKEDPIKYAGQAFPDLKLQPIQDWNNSGFAVQELTKRAMNAETISQRFGSRPTILSKAEVAGFMSFMSGLEANDQAVYINNLSKALFKDGDGTALAILSTQFGDKKQEYVTALGLASTQKGQDDNLAMHQIMGNYSRLNRIGEGYKAESEVRQKLLGILPTGPNSQQNELMVLAVMNEHCYANQNLGKSQTVNDSIKKVFGEVLEFNGKKIFLPTKLDDYDADGWTFTTEGDFKDLLAQYAKENSKQEFFWAGVKVEPERLASMINSCQLQYVRDGQYRLIKGLAYVTDKNGQPVLMNLNPIIDKRSKK